MAPSWAVLTQRPTGFPPYELRKSIDCVSIGHPPFGVRLGRKWTPLRKPLGSDPRYVLSYVGQANMQRIKRHMSFPLCCTLTKPFLRVAALVADKPAKLPHMLQEGLESGPADPPAPPKSADRRDICLGSFSSCSGPRSPLVVAGHTRKEMGHRRHASSFLQTSCPGGVRQSPQMQPCRVSR
jgi:hypothetical protein